MVGTPTDSSTVTGNNYRWYKTSSGIVFLIFIGLVIVGVALFMGLVGYYLWQVRFGDAEGLAQQFAQEHAARISTLNKKDNLGNLAGDKIINNFEKYIRKTNPVFGKSDAGVKVLMFIDFECPFCQEEYSILKEVMGRYQSAVKFVFKNFPLESIHPNSFTAANAAACASEQGKFWPYYDWLFKNKTLDQNSLVAGAVSLGIDHESFAKCLDSQKYQEEINQDLIDSSELNLRGTPAFLVNGEKLEGVVTKEELDKIILKYLKR